MKLLITAGGTGGHIMPAMAIVEALRDKDPASEILFVGTSRGMEEKIAGTYGLDFVALDALGIKGKSPMQVVRAAGVNAGAFIRALGLVRSFKPDWVVGTGGYVTGMVVLAGRMLGARCAIQEQNSFGGLTNRMLSRLVQRVFLAFPDTAGAFPEAKSIVSGNPVRKAIVRDEKKGLGDYLLILGGSLGASSINEAAVKALQILKNEGLAFKVVHQSGAGDYQAVQDAYRQMGLSADVHDFIADMNPVYNGARMAICRCGGLTLSELSVTGLPAIMVPFPHAADDHQMKNGRYVEAHGGGWIIPDEHLKPERLCLEIKKRFFDDDMLQKTASNLLALHLGNGSKIIAEEIIGV